MIAKIDAKGQFWSKLAGGSALPEGDANISSGMTLRDWFAGQAMNGLYSAFGDNFQGREEDLKLDAEVCYRIADAMLRGRGK